MRPRIGVVNWDAIYPSYTYFGGHSIQTLGNRKYSDRLPYYTRIDENGDYYFAERDQSDYDRELEIAVAAEIDFFMYCWYPDGDDPKDIGKEEYGYLAPHYHELNKARKLYQSSLINKKIKMCAIIISGSGYSKNDFALLAESMSEDYYEKKDGRPLVFIFGGYRIDYILAIRDAASSKGLEPYVVFMNNGVESVDGDYSQADAVSTYAVAAGNINSYEELAAQTVRSNEKRKKYGLPIIPMLSAGWNPSPRIDRPVPWCKYADIGYAPHPTGKQMEAAALDLFRWMSENSEYVDKEYCVCFAWNEFEEGGYLCPTLKMDGTSNSDTLDGLGRALRKRKTR